MNQRMTLMLALLAVALAACGSGEKRRELGERERVWRVGVERQLPPVSFVDGQRVRGLAVEMIEAVADVQGYGVELRVGESAELRAALESGEIDVIAHMPISDALEARFNLTLPHWFTEDAIFFNARRGAPGCPIGDARYASERVIVLEDDPSLEWASGRGLETLVRASVLEALLALDAGEAGCAVLPNDSATILVDRLGYDEKKIEKRPGGRVRDYDRTLAFAVRLDEAALQEELEEGLQILSTTDRYRDIFERWDGWRGDVQWPRWLLWALAPVALLVIWTWSLRRTVARRTAELKAEMLERERLERRIQQSRKMESLGVLAGGIAHDFNNLLMGVLGNASLALMQMPEDSPLRPRLDEIRKAGRRAADLCGQMLAYSGKGRFVLEPVDLADFLRQKERDLVGALGPGVRLDLSLARHLPEIHGDRSQLMQMLGQLVGNAAEAIEERGGAAGVGNVTLRVSEKHVGQPFENAHLGVLCPPGDYVELVVEDDGAGMDEATLARIFEPFFSTKFTGRGLGLAAVLGIVRAHRGAIEVSSAVGGGTRIEVLLPTSSQAAGAEGPMAEPETRSAGRGAEGSATPASTETAIQ